MPGLIERYRRRLPLPPESPSLSLGEGSTPLVELRHLPKMAGVNIRLFAKTEGANPTASFKDRGMVVAVCAALGDGATCVLCASTGNTSAAAAAYAARAGLPCIVLIPQGKVAAGKIAQAVIHGARIVQIDGSFDDAMGAVKQFSDNTKVAIVNSINPMRLQGQKTVAFEVTEELGDAPDFHALPVGNAGNITAHWIGYSEAARQPTNACNFCGGDCKYDFPPLAKKRPILLGYQATNAAPFVAGKIINHPDTVATAIRIGDPQSFFAAKIAVQESGGKISAIDDDDLLQMQKNLAAYEGIFCEPASAIGVAGVIKDARAGNLPAAATVVCTLTGHGLKDPDIVGKPNVQTTAAPDIHRALTAIIK